MSYSNYVTVPGIIEAWGKITYGNMGFRAEHARIAALVLPPKLSLMQELRHRWTCHAPRHGFQGGWYSTLCSIPFTAMHRDVIVARYPNVPVFDTIAEAEAKFPVTPLDTMKSVVEELS